MNNIFHYIPENPFPFEGGVTLFSTDRNIFYHIWFGSGDNLDEDDIDNGFDDYMNIDAYKWNGERPLMEVINNIRESDGYIDEVDGLEDTDGGMMLIKRADYNNSGDIRDYLKNSLDFVNYGVDNVENLYNDLIFITAHS